MWEAFLFKAVDCQLWTWQATMLKTDANIRTSINGRKNNEYVHRDSRDTAWKAAEFYFSAQRSSHTPRAKTKPPKPRCQSKIIEKKYSMEGARVKIFCERRNRFIAACLPAGHRWLAAFLKINSDGCLLCLYFYQWKHHFVFSWSSLYHTVAMF